MAKAAKPAGIFADIDPEAQYEVTLRRPLKIGRSWARPGTFVTLKGKVVLEHQESIDGVSPVTA